MCFSKINAWHNTRYKWKFMWKYSNKITELVMYGAAGLIWQCVSCPHTTHACTCHLLSFTSQTKLTSSLVSYIPKQSSTILPHGSLVWLGFHNTHTNQPEPPTLTITNGESSSPISQSRAHAPPHDHPFPLDHLNQLMSFPRYFIDPCVKKNYYSIDPSVTSAFPVNLVTKWCFMNLNVPR